MKGALHCPPALLQVPVGTMVWCAGLGILPSTCTHLCFTCSLVIPPLKERVWKFPCVQLQAVMFVLFFLFLLKTHSIRKEKVSKRISQNALGYYDKFAEALD